MPNESATNPQDATPHQAAPVSQDEKPSRKSFGAEEDPLEEIRDAPALEEDEDSLVKPENS
ncbi:hypothetical protein IWX65_002821 [Arthrobacter sp. CAN_A214]|uniref:hypothetical protein n=1 Tax=Arthrobacter sp. CAN_A214 TaxID=2787720 RepID=UPI0018CB7A07